MSTLQKMSIQGIRSFGPDDKDKQVMIFFNPLTLILGPNGTGKTTVIECLKYMTTGSMPPGTKGGAFIHDPKVAHETEVKGQVRLQFSDISGKGVVVQRSMLVTQKRKKVEMKTLDGVITRLNAAGEKVSISSKCAEIDKEMITSLGVSKPVLENVIFCHQEEANWPLSEGKALKEKFDAIFASTRYVKALESIRKLKQTQEQEVKLLKQDIYYLKQHKDKAVQLEGDLSEVQVKLTASKESVKNITDKLAPIQAKLDQINKSANEVFKIQNNISKLESEMKEMQNTAGELQDNIENEFQGTTEELEQVVQDFNSKVKQRENKLQEYIRRQENAMKEMDQLVRTKNNLLVEVGRLEQEAKVNEENIMKRDEDIRLIAEKYDFSGLGGNITDEKYKHFLENIREKLDVVVQEGRKLKGEFEEEEAELQRKIDDMKEKKAKLEQEKHIKRNMMDDNNTKVRLMNQKLSEVAASAGKRDQVTRELKRGEHDLQVTEEAVNVEAVKVEISQLNKDKVKLDAQISELSSEMNRLHLQSNAQAQLDVHKKDKLEREQTIRRLKAKQEDTIIYLLEHMPLKNIRGELNEYISKQTHSVKKLQQELQKSNTQLSSREAEKKMIGENLRKKENELKNLEERIFSVCGSQNFDDDLQTLQQKKTQCQDQKGSLLGAEHFFKKYVDDLEKDEPCCPLCHREFDTDQEVKELIIELKDKLKLVPTRLQKTEKDLVAFEKKYDAMMQLKPLKENVTTLEGKEIPEMKNKYKKLNEEIEKLRNLILDRDEEMQTKQQDEDMAKQIVPDIVTVDRIEGEVQELEKKIATQAALLSGGDSGRTLQDVINEKEDIQMQVDTISKKLDRQRQKLSDHSEEVQRLKSKINTLKEEKLRIDSDLQQRNKLEEDKATLLKENETYKNEIQEASEELRPLQIKIEKLKQQKDETTQNKEEQVEQSKAEIDKVKNEATKVKNRNQDIKAYNQSGGKEKLERSRAKRQRVDDDIAQQEEDQDKVTKTIDKLRQDLATAQIRERELNDNLQLRKKIAEIERVEADIEKYKEKLGGIDAMNMERDRKRLIAQQEDFIKQRHIADGRQREQEEQIKGLRKELNSDMYKGAAEKYTDKMINMRTTELANSDLEKYYKALDKAIMSYHNLKMDEINKIIRELWRNTYRGNDIETIEIRSDEDEGGIMKTRRNYNYRVVMVKGDAALDMRGRCSAGQKVLASLIIRLALAETFCLNCGVLALDEPTTNLDRENIESLAYALVEIIKAREQQKNFQLIVITHDEDFVDLLGRSDYVEEFFKVQKDPNGCSQLVKSRVSQLHTG